MAENQIVQNKEIKTGRVFRKGYFFIGFIPFFIVTALQTATTIPGIVLATYDLSKSGQSYDLKTLMEVFNQKYALWGYIAYCLLCYAVFIPWYIKACVRKNPAVNYRKALGIKPLALSAGVMIGLFFVVSGVFTAVDLMFPRLMDAYKQLMEISSLGTNLSITIVYGILLGPVAEELCFRGIMFGLFEKSNMHHMLLIFLQGLLFGIMHMNLTQGLYAMAMGMVLGYIRYKYKTVIISSIVHIIFNAAGTLGANFLVNIGVNDYMDMIFGIIAAVMVAGLFVLIVKDKEVYVKDEVLMEALTGVKDD